jgi:hypothetical protein
VRNLARDLLAPQRSLTPVFRIQSEFVIAQLIDRRYRDIVQRPATRL